jgi:hypothetical protein
MKRVGVVLVVAACGSSSSNNHPDAQQIDAAHQMDGLVDGPVDAAPDVPDDAVTDAAMPTGTHHHYVINSIDWPTTNNEARADGFDLNGDGVVDNQLGSTIAALAAQGMDVQTPQDVAVARGTVLMLADFQATDLTTATDAGFTLYAGTNPNPAPCNGSGDTVCGHHLTGTGTFDAAAMPRENPIVGAIASGVYSGGPGKLPVELSVLGGTPISTTLLGARAKLTATASGITQGIIGGGIPTTDLQTMVYPAMQQAFEATVQADCTQLASPPACGCSGTGQQLIALFDTNHDCAISVMEIENNSLIQSLFAPDVTIDGQMALSVGFGVTAVGATFTP